jgi:hypothetical protein
MEVQISTGVRKAEFWLITSSRTGASADGNPHETALVQEKGRLRRWQETGFADLQIPAVITGILWPCPQRVAALHPKTERIWPATAHFALARRLL